MFSFSNKVNDKSNGKRHTARPAGARGRRCQVESLERRNLFASVVSLTLVDALTDRDIMTVSDGATIDFAALGTNQLNIRANVDSDVESVRFALDDIADFRTENSAPYTLAGDQGANYHAWTPAPGDHTLTATPFSADDAGGSAGTAMSISFTVVEGVEPDPAAPPMPPTNVGADATSPTSVELSWTDASHNESGFYVDRSTDGGKTFTRLATLGADVTGYTDDGGLAATTYHYRVATFNDVGWNSGAAIGVTTPDTPLTENNLKITGITLVNADTGQDIMPLVDGITLDLNALPTRNLGVRVDATGEVLSVRFGLDGNASYRIESSRPLSLSGDVGGKYNPWTPAVGAHTLTVTPYSAANASGTAGEAVTVNFTVLDNVTLPVAPSGLAATATSSSQINLAWADNSSNEAGFRIERSLDGTNWTQVGSVGAGVKSYIASGLNASTTYYFRVSAYNAAGTAASNVADATTNAPTDNDNVGARPGPDNTGPTDTSNMSVYNGLLKITTDGAVVENIEVYGGILIEANNVTLRNFRIVANSYYGINISSGSSGIVIEDGEITGAKSAGLKGGGFTARRLNLHHFGADAIKPGSNVLVEDSWIHHLGMSDGAHADGVQVKGSASNLVFRGNFFDMPSGLEGFTHNSAFIMDPNGGSITGLVIDGNWINGGGWTIHITESVSSAVVTNNLFGRDYNFGVKRVGSSTIWDNNRWWDTLELVGQ